MRRHLQRQFKLQDTKLSLVHETQVCISEFSAFYRKIYCCPGWLALSHASLI